MQNFRFAKINILAQKLDLQPKKESKTFYLKCLLMFLKKMHIIQFSYIKIV